MVRGWTRFRDLMPSVSDADSGGQIVAAGPRGGDVRRVDWNWVMTAELWEANGFIDWRRCSLVPKRRAVTTTPFKRGQKLLTAAT